MFPLNYTQKHTSAFNTYLLHACSPSTGTGHGNLSEAGPREDDAVAPEQSGKGEHEEGGRRKILICFTPANSPAAAPALPAAPVGAQVSTRVWK